MPARDIVVVAGSAGAVQELRVLIGELPGDFPGSVFVVLHTSAEGPGLLAQVLDRAGPLPVLNPLDHQIIERGHVYVAPPDHHLLVDGGHIQLGRGPRENGFRPAADPLFRSAAQSYGPRVVGIVLSGGMDDGTLGLQVIKHHGGIAVVQRPDDALNPGMPQSALKSVKIDHVLPVRQMPQLLLELACNRSPQGGTPVKESRHEKGDPAIVADLSPDLGPLKGPPSPFICPGCGGPLWEMDSDGLLHYRCHVGHAYTAKTLVAGQDGATDDALWTALRTLEETAALRRRLAGDARSRKLIHVATGYEDRAHQIEERAGVIRKVLLSDHLPKGLKGHGSARPAEFLAEQARKTTNSKKRR